MRKLAWTAFAALMMAGPVSANEVHVASGSAAIASPSRIDDHEIGAQQIVFEYQWPGVYFESPFSGQFVTVKLKDSANRLTFYVDGKAVKTVNRPGDSATRLGPFDSGNHMLRIEKLSESQGDAATLIGVFPDSKPGVLPLPERLLQIEFIGDSYTVGYGNTSGKQKCTQDEIWATTDTQQAFGPLTAKHYNADYQINAISGRGIVRNYDGFIADPLPVVYPYILFDKKDAYDYPNWRPQIVVIALGGNDFSTPVHAGDKWKTLEELRADYIATYVTFVKQLRSTHPGASFILMNYGEDEIIKDTAEVVRRLNADGETRVATFSAGNDFTHMACDWHLDLDDDKKISQRLITYIDAHADLWQGRR